MLSKVKLILKKIVPLPAKSSIVRFEKLEKSLAELAVQCEKVNDVDHRLEDLMSQIEKNRTIQEAEYRETQSRQRDFITQTKGIRNEILDNIDTLKGLLEQAAKNNVDEVHGLQTKHLETIQQLQSMKLQMEQILLDVGKTTETNLKRRLPNKSIQKELWELAALETAQYVADSMAKVRVFNSESELLEFAVNMAGEGMYLEFGVFKGSTINQIATIKSEVDVYGFDSFEGLPEDWRSGFTKGMFYKDELPEVPGNVILKKGWFEETLPLFLKEKEGTCAFIHIDCDLYSSTRTVFDNLKNRIIPGTIILFDEFFNYPSWRDHEYKAFQEFVKENAIIYEYIGYVECYEQAAVQIVSVRNDVSLEV